MLCDRHSEVALDHFSTNKKLIYCGTIKSKSFHKDFQDQTHSAQTQM